MPVRNVRVFTMALKNIEECTADRRRFVLVVDGSDRNRQFLSTLLTRFEYSVFAAKTMQETLEIVNSISPVLIVAARQLDGGNDAVRLMRSIRSADPKFTTPVIVLNNRPDPAFERACLEAGALTYLRAPITIENFYRVIQVAVEPMPRMTLRISTNLPVMISGTRKDERVQGISENGAYILTSSPYPRNTKLPVRIKLTECMISADAVVLYVKKSDGNGHSGMGLLFERISPEDQRRIRLFIREEMTKTIKN
jgi:CheY-like chemotaxis protein